MTHSKHIRSSAKTFIDVAPLTEPYWTGIATVTANLVKYFLKHYPLTTRFFVGPHLVAHDCLSAAVTGSPGGYLRILLDDGAAMAGGLADAVGEGQSSYGIFPGIKPFHRFFDHEMVIVHDLSPLLTPELHTELTVRSFGEALLKDTLSSDLICCVSEATRQDTIIYLPIPPEKTFVALLGSDWNGIGSTNGSCQSVLPYIVVLGTLEPRKNLKLIASLLVNYPELLSEFVFIFVGTSGWGPDPKTIFESLLTEDGAHRSLVFTGYLPEFEKRSLVARATCAIYPSLFEGFGLPVLECMSVGCPTLTSRTSSLMELGVPADYQFDPFSVCELHESLRKLLALSEAQRGVLSQELIAKSLEFSWERFGDRIVSALSAL